ncbi:MAG: MaoC/PaaZ C-terminal domain-containing protein [Spongiibacteraceae bacterium]
MSIDYDHLMAIEIPDVHQQYTGRDTMLYALSLGLGQDPTNSRHLPFVYESGQKCLPTYGTTLGHPGFWLKDMDTGVDWVKVVHAQQELLIHRPLPVAADIIARQKIVDVIDRGEGRGAMIIWQRSIIDAHSGDALCTINQYMLARGDGGFGGPAKTLVNAASVPDRPADVITTRETSAQMALLYRLNGDWNPLHADPEVAKSAGFQRPILHGLATWGVAATAVVDEICNFDVSKVISVAGRFTAPVYPGETFRIEIWVDGSEICFRVTVPARDVVALNNGLIRLSA